MKEKAHEYINELLREHDIRKDFLTSREPVSTIYIGGGTPSQLPVEELLRLINNIQQKYSDSLTEITIEANPEDISLEWVNAISGLNKDILRISLGVQSLDDGELRMLNRRHNSHKPQEAVRLLRNVGIKNISLDLMYGLPNQTINSWEKSIDGILALNPEHISAYCLSIEEGTRMERMVNEGKLIPADDEQCLKMAALLRKKLKAAGYIQYEISNYSKPGYESKHNSSYWDGTPYLGLGPGAHSYDGKRLRMWNVGNLEEYLKGNRIEGSETLSDTDIYNEKIMLGLRTNKGIDETLPNLQKLPIHLMSCIKKIDGHIVLTEKGLALADEVIRELII